MVICTLFGRVVEFASYSIPKLAPSAKPIGVVAEIGCESASEIGKHIIKKLKYEEMGNQQFEELKNTHMCYPDSRQQRNIDSIKLRNNLNKFRATKPTYKDRIKRNARFADRYSNYKKSQRLLLT